ncbi:glycoside hydrolase family 51 protein [Plicaturopsis crispa FD-325 SS-3]|uniref:non-reducing end alpha-L-arabinofuranosidase n=1 Tax=Plicaturopsis crispa FD-325 SS-3 TaxID=944288 RepID=A0A0C9SXX9_PLICR|nr:glycoside hydrolase family 51 protein [Plicaturopsis crispa FD-325 SS-3]
MPQISTFTIASTLALCASYALGATTVVVNGTASHAIPSTLFLQNRAFQKVTAGTDAALSGWAPVNSGSIKVVADSNPVSSALPNSLQLTVPDATGAVGFGNSGYFGIKVDSSWTYNASFYYKFPTASSFTGNVVVALSSAADGTVFGSATIPISGAQTTWKQVSATLKPNSSATDTANNFTLTVEGASGETISFALFSLFPPTYKGRTNGMRIDIAETLASMKPAFFRLPGGNNLGQTTATRWQWNATVGPLVDRPGRVGDWGYVNTDGLGLYEYLEWCEDVGMEAIMAVWAGYSLGGTSLAENELGPYIQQAIDQINFAVGDSSKSDAAALRASLGHPDPFNVTYIEIGNEDFFASDSYVYRWRDFEGNLTAAFPNLRFIATSYTSGPVLSPSPKQYDVHVYQTPEWFFDNAFYYDSFQRNGTTYFEGEYAAISTNSGDLYGTPADGRLLFPTVQGSTGEAAFMTGLERNSDIVFAASYAPLLGHVVSSQWTPNLVNFDAGAVYPSTSFYVQQLFSANKGDEYLPSTLPTSGSSLHWSVVRAGQQIIIKVANAGADASDLTFQLPFSTVASSGMAQVLTGSVNATNSNVTPNAVTPKTSTVSTGKNFDYTAPAYSLSVLTLDAQ